MLEAFIKVDKFPLVKMQINAESYPKIGDVVEVCTISSGAEKSHWIQVKVQDIDVSVWGSQSLPDIIASSLKRIEDKVECHDPKVKQMSEEDAKVLLKEILSVPDENKNTIGFASDIKDEVSLSDLIAEARQLILLMQDVLDNIEDKVDGK